MTEVARKRRKVDEKEEGTIVDAGRDKPVQLDLTGWKDDENVFGQFGVPREITSRIFLMAMQMGKIRRDWAVLCVVCLSRTDKEKWWRYVRERMLGEMTDEQGRAIHWSGWQREVIHVMLSLTFRGSLRHAALFECQQRSGKSTVVRAYLRAYIRVVENPVVVIGSAFQRTARQMVRAVPQNERSAIHASFKHCSADEALLSQPESNVLTLYDELAGKQACFVRKRQKHSHVFIFHTRWDSYYRATRDEDTTALEEASTMILRYPPNPTDEELEHAHQRLQEKERLYAMRLSGQWVFV